MYAIDTNVLVRLLTQDDASQAARAVALFRAEKIFIPKTVVLETEWVLRRLYRLERAVVIDAFHKLGELDNVEIEQFAAINEALTLNEKGMDFADALHLASSKNSQKFATFDEKMKQSAPVGITPKVQLL
ncbi:MAG: type II toxin-antitoxin system VapC family toxin [Gallionella sp.]|nr:type II toxin-antitoxin system VapC family toxin [Gallionella sp.]MDD4958020.1 type II toxin-antitoxin system VapC family toxin [Gallionella sp.]